MLIQKTYLRQVRINSKVFNDEFEALDLGIGGHVVVSETTTDILYSNIIKCKHHPLCFSPVRVLFKDYYPFIEWQCDIDLPLEVLKEIFLLNFKYWESVQ